MLSSISVSFPNFCVVYSSLFFSRSTKVNAKVSSFDFWVTQSPLKLFNNTAAYTHTHTHTHTRTRHLVTASTHCASQHDRSCRIFRASFSLTVRLKETIDCDWKTQFFVAKFFHEHLCFTLSYRGVSVTLATWNRTSTFVAENFTDHRISRIDGVCCFSRCAHHRHS